MIKINLLPKEARKRVGVWDQIIILILIVSATIVGIVVWHGWLNGRIDQLNENIAKTQQRLDELQKVIAEIEEFERQRQALEDKLRIIAKLEKEQQLPVHLLAILALFIAPACSSSQQPPPLIRFADLFLEGKLHFQKLFQLLHKLFLANKDQ